MKFYISRQPLILLYGMRVTPSIKIVSSWEGIEPHVEIKKVGGRRIRVPPVYGLMARDPPPDNWEPPEVEGTCYICAEYFPIGDKIPALETPTLISPLLLSPVYDRKGITFTEKAHEYLINRYRDYPLLMDEEIERLDEICLDRGALPLSLDDIKEILPSWKDEDTYNRKGSLIKSIKKPIAPELNKQWAPLMSLPLSSSWERLSSDDMVRSIRAIQAAKRGIPLRLVGAASLEEKDSDHLI